VEVIFPHGTGHLVSGFAGTPWCRAHRSSVIVLLIVTTKQRIDV